MTSFATAFPAMAAAIVNGDQDQFNVSLPSGLLFAAKRGQTVLLLIYKVAAEGAGKRKDV